MIRTSALLFTAFLPLVAWPEQEAAAPTQAVDSASTEAPAAPRTSMRSQQDNRFWLGTHLGVVGGAAWGGMYEFNARIRVLGPCGVMAAYRHEKIYVHDPATMDNYQWGVGGACQIVSIGKSKKFWRGFHLVGYALAQYGVSHYAVYYVSQGQRHDVLTDVETGAGIATGADFYFPLWWGGWVTGGVGYQSINYNFNEPQYVNGDPFPGLPESSINLRVGLSHSF